MAMIEFEGMGIWVSMEEPRSTLTKISEFSRRGGESVAVWGYMTFQWGEAMVSHELG